MKTQAAVLVETGKPLIIADLEIPVLKAGQVLVKVAYSGVCHTQVLECRGYRGEDKFLPHCMGHEGSGVVKEVGPGVSKVKVGDKVILSWIKGAGGDVLGTIYDWEGKKVNAGAITTFSCYSVISENRLTVLTEDISLAEAALLGCAVPTGVGAVLNVAQPFSGSSLVVFGVGGVGLCALAAARVSGCNPIIAVDINENKLKLAKILGATQVVNPTERDPIKVILDLCPGGADFAIESSGRPVVMLQAINCLRSQGGTVVIVGNARFGEKLELDPKQFNLGKKLLGTWGGDSKPDRDYPKYCQLIKTGNLQLKPLISQTYSLSQVNMALDALETGQSIRPLLDMSLA